MPDLDGYTADLQITATARAVHPPNVVLDEAGHPVLDEAGDPIFQEQK